MTRGRGGSGAEMSVNRPIQLWEGILVNIDAKSYVHSLTHDGTYNVRAFSSTMGETFLSELIRNDKRGQGTVTGKEFGEYIGYSAEQLQIRLDQDRQGSFDLHGRVRFCFHFVD